MSILPLLASTFSDPGFLADPVVALLRRDGVVPPIPSRFQAQSVYDHLSSRTVYNAHVAAKATARAPFEQAVKARNWPMFCWTMEDIVTAPHILELAIEFLPLAQDYFGEDPVLYSMNCFCTQPAPTKYEDTHYWHVDGDDRKQLVAFFLITDINAPEDGAHIYQRGSHNVPEQDLGYSWREPPLDKVALVTGKAGSVFFADTRGFHMAYRPKNNIRMVAWARFGVTDPPVSYGWDKLSPVSRALVVGRYPNDPKVQRAIRLVIA